MIETFLLNDLSRPETRSHIVLPRNLTSDNTQGAVSNISLIEGGFLGPTGDHLKSNMKYDGAGDSMQPTRPASY